MGVGGQSYTPAALPPGKTRYTLYRRLGEPQSRSGRVRNISPTPGLDPGTVQPVASRCTDCTISTHQWAQKNCKFTCPTIIKLKFQWLLHVWPSFRFRKPTFCPNNAFTCSKENGTISVSRTERLVIVMQARHVYCAARTTSLSIRLRSVFFCMTQFYLASMTIREYTRWFKYDRDWFVCKQAALRSSCATLREWSHNLHPPSCSG